MTTNRVTQTEMFGNEREEAILQQFRSLLSDLVRIVRHATNARTIALHWVNRQRSIFVPESHASSRSDVVFKDRIPFGSYFLDTYLDLSEPKWLQIGKDIDAESLSHYYDRTFHPDGFVYLQPFRSNDETVAITVIETESKEWTPSATEALSAFAASLDNLLHTYLELSNLLESQKGWLVYDKALDDLTRRRDAVAMIWEVANLAETIIPSASVSLLLRGFSDWKVMSNRGKNGFGTGMPISGPSLANDALKTGSPTFSLHINSTPHRISSREQTAMGATMALPIRAGDTTQAILVVHNQDALAFHDANRHQLINLARVAGLKLDLLLKSSRGDLFNAPNGALKPDVADAIIDQQLNLLRETDQTRTDYNVWVVYTTLADYSSIRTRLSSEELKTLHKHVLSMMAQTDNGIFSIVTYHADHIHGCIISGKDEKDIHTWGSSINKKLSKTYSTDSQDIQIRLHIVAVKLNPSFDDAFAVSDRARKALNQIVRNAETGLQIIDSNGDG